MATKITQASVVDTLLAVINRQSMAVYLYSMGLKDKAVIEETSAKAIFSTLKIEDVDEPKGASP